MTRDEALALYGLEWWVSASNEEIVGFQLYEPLLCMPFGKYHEAVEKVLGRSVWTHGFAFIDGLKAEFEGKAEPRTMEQIIALLPSEKTIIVELPSDD